MQRPIHDDDQNSEGDFSEVSAIFLISSFKSTDSQIFISIVVSSSRTKNHRVEKK